jgi:hypothetical protein
MQQIAIVLGLFQGGRWFKCSIVVQSPRQVLGLGLVISL